MILAERWNKRPIRTTQGTRPSGPELKVLLFCGTYSSSIIICKRLKIYSLVCLAKVVMEWKSNKRKKFKRTQMRLVIVGFSSMVSRSRTTNCQVSAPSIFNKVGDCLKIASAGSLLACQPSPCFLGWTTRIVSLFPFPPPSHPQQNPNPPLPCYITVLSTPFARTTTSVMACCASGLFGLTTAASPFTSQTGRCSKS